jgi:sulfate/thiosulfate transport system substrate-binding protein
MKSSRKLIGCNLAFGRAFSLNGRLAKGWLVTALQVIIALSILWSAGCRRRSDVAKEATITLYGFSVIREPLEKEIFPAYRAEWRAKTGQDLSFIPSYAGSEIVTNQIVAGVEADVAILAIERNADRLVETGSTNHNWRRLPHHGILNRTPMVILVRKGNPRRIREFGDLGRTGVRLIHSDPVSSGAGQWGVLAIYGGELLASERLEGVRNPARALATLRSVWKNVVSTPGSAREARTQFERGEGEALVTYEMEALQLLEKSNGFEMIVPTTTILAEHPVVIINHPIHGMTPARYAIVELFVRSLWDRPAQEALVRARFRAVIDDALNERFVKIAHQFTVADLGGWAMAYPEIIDKVWKQQIQNGTDSPKITGN